MADILRNARAAAGVLSDDRLQGLSEIIQNADDCGATKVAFYQIADALIAVHDGRPLTLRDVHALAAPWLTTKRDDATATGRFGIGLSTLHTLAETFQLHSGAYHLMLGDPTLRTVEGAPVPEGLAGTGDTAIYVPLKLGSLAAGELLRWCADWDDASLLFLDSVRQVSFTAGTTSRTLQLQRGMTTVRLARWDGADREVTRSPMTAPDGRSWLRYDAVLDSPAGLARAHKTTHATTPVSVALPLAEARGGYLASGLPVTHTPLPMCANAQFDPVASRRDLVDNPWNRALAHMVAMLWQFAVADVFAEHPAEGWALIPVEKTRQGASGLGTRLQDLIAGETSAALGNEVRLPVTGVMTRLSQLAYEEEALEGLLTAEESAELAGLGAALPVGCRDTVGRWRAVLERWRQLETGVPAPVTVEQALPLVERPQRGVHSCIALVAAVLNAGLAYRLRALRCIVTSGGEHVAPPSVSSATVLVRDVSGLVAVLGTGVQLHAAYFADSHAPSTVRAWLRNSGVLAEEAADDTLLRALARAGRDGVRLPRALTDDQLRHLRDALEQISPQEREHLGAGIGRAILLDAFRFDAQGKKVRVATVPAETYQPTAIDREQDSFAVAAGAAPNLRWLAPRYASALRSPLGRAGLGPQRLLRLLGAETVPRIAPHPRLERRFEDARLGVARDGIGSPTDRREALRDLGATYSLDDLHSPDLQEVIEDIARDADPSSRRRRARALLGVLGRAWPTLGEQAQVPAAHDYYVWQVKGSVRAWWVWQAASVAWLDDIAGTPRRAADSRLRTPATLAVYGSDADGYLHPDIASARTEVLTTLGVSGEPGTRQLVDRLRQLRDAPPQGVDLNTETAVVYQTLAGRVGRSDHSSHDVTPQRLKHLFGAGDGLIWTRAAWHRPTSVFRGAPVFGAYRPSVPQVPGSDPLWKALGVRAPDLDDCVAVLQEVAKQRKGSVDQAVLLDVLRLMERICADSGADPRQLRRLRRAPVLTTHGWLRQRPLYAVEDSAVATGIGSALPVWTPGGEVSQFPHLIKVFQLHAVGREHVAVVPPGMAWVDERTTELARAGVRLLREDLARNDPALHAALTVPWAALEDLKVSVVPELKVSVSGLPDGIVREVPVNARLDSTSCALLVRAPELAEGVDGGQALAALFDANRRTLAQAWLAATEAARRGRHASDLRLANEVSAAQGAVAAAAIYGRLASVQEQAAERRSRRRVHPSSGGGTSASRVPEASPDGQPSLAAPGEAETFRRRLVDPATLVVVDPNGTIVAGSGAAPSPSSGRSRGVQLRDPQPAAPPVARTPGRAYTDLEKESLGIELVRRVLGSDSTELLDLRAQHGVGADAVDELKQYYELKVSAGAEPDQIVLEDSEIRRAMSTQNFFLVVVSGLEGERATPQVRIIVDPLSQLRMSTSSQVRFSGVRQSQSLVFKLRPRNDEARGADADAGADDGRRNV
ncbi:hypothetical protein SAMN05444351_3090 [Geodermatophilus nigrescens]|uniref:Protein NO VEIN C-terminal domain-containing protein n=2 Tax=Geodermatophilus nigrescens TaxID=1070870 RepID=A0A1M5M9S6_9ACTN|nr:hypothetical protein SAMN05444351_3090 [Geodermatophilus nigrescens]